MWPWGWLALVYVAAAYLTYYALFQHRWQRPQTMNAGWKARQ